MDATGTALRTVGRFEADLLRILHGLLGKTSSAEVLPLLLRSHSAPRCLSRSCVELVADALSNGLTESFAVAGWSAARFVDGDRVREGRLWERIPPERLGLVFSPETLRWLIWTTAHDVLAPAAPLETAADRLTLGDRCLFFRAFDALRETLVAPALLNQPAFRDDGLIALAFPDVFAEHDGEHDEGVAASDLAPGPDDDFWLRPTHAWVLESLQRWLRMRWIEIEESKRSSADPQRLCRIGRAQQRVLDRFLTAAHRAGRWDLARFVMEAAIETLPRAATDEAWLKRLDLRNLSLAERQQCRRAAIVLPAALGRLRDWRRAAGTIGFHDEGYRAGQLWKSDWDRWGGDRVCAAADEVVRRADPLRTGGGA